MTYDYVKRAYGVAPEPGQRVRHTVSRHHSFGVVADEDPGCGRYVMVLFDGAPHALPCHPGELDYAPDDSARLPMWAVYDHPSDHPDHYVARRWLTLPQPVPTHELRKATTLDELQQRFSSEGLAKLARMPSDDPKILETWL